MEGFFNEDRKQNAEHPESAVSDPFEIHMLQFVHESVDINPFKGNLSCF